ncbi:YciI family protein [Actinomycetospora sp. TBRC 11914]|uniref:YciI family protein n=1 Tax=Actinomycetospora sp. TBRC 11914 TaxID=2729387 RepID=UPI00145E334F|nr:YciI family protein [Actinomycetospora sp. TBRC 11914]NMO93969.1 YciI family protein [Actinomycetospora sp. TBRC 11914]
MKYVILLHSNPDFAARFEALTPEQRSRFGSDHMALTRELTASGELVVSEGLADPSLARWVSTAQARPVVSDGPFAETKEHLAGFYLVDVESAARAEEIAARVPDAVWGLVEVRPVLDTSGWDV